MRTWVEIDKENLKYNVLKLKEIGDNTQIISITHSPVIASKASQQFYIEKYVENSKTISRVKKLSAEERIKEINFQIAILNEPLKNIEELEILNQQYNNIKFNSEKYVFYENDENYKKAIFWLNNEYHKRKEILKAKEEEKMPLSQFEIEKLIKEKKELHNLELSKIINEEKDDIISNIASKNELGEIDEFEDIKGNPYFKLLKFLIKKGHLDEEYPLYMSYFYGKSDANFIKTVLMPSKENR